MIRLTVLSGPNRGFSSVVSRFPLTIGRAPDAGWVLSEPGVWDRHATLSLDAAGAFSIRAESQAMVVVNGVSMPEVEIRGGDVIELGSVKISFSLSETRQRSFRVREWSTWISVAALCIGQMVLIYLVLP